MVCHRCSHRRCDLHLLLVKTRRTVWPDYDLHRHGSNCTYGFIRLAISQQSVIYSIIFFALAAACYGVISRIEHGTSILGDGSLNNYWSRDNIRKYEQFYGSLVSAPKCWYYRVNKLQYRERFLFSATILVFLTDGFHLIQFFMIKFLVLTIVAIVNEPVDFVWWKVFVIYLIAWLFFFQVTYIVLKRRD